MKKNLILVSVFVAGALALSQTVVSGTTSSPDFKVSAKVVQNLKATAQSDILIFLKEQASLNAASYLVTKEAKGKYVVDQLKKTAQRSQADLVDLLESKNLDYQQFYITNMIAVEDVDVSLIKQLAARDDVASIASNSAVRLNFFTPDHPFAQQAVLGVGDNIRSTGAVDVWDKIGTKGAGIIIAGQDTGVDWTHPALINSYLGNVGGKTDHAYAWHDSIRKAVTSKNNKCGYGSVAPCDDDEHGTHTVGTMVGDDGQGNQIGMAPDAKWMACRNMDEGNGRPSTYIECFEFFLAPYPQGEEAMTAGDPTRAPHIINNSWGCIPAEGCSGQEMTPVLKALHQAGIMTVVSAGNDGPGCGTIKDQPATLSPYTLTVGAHDHKNGKIADFSSRGPSALDGQVGPDLTAPGVNVRSAIPGGKYAGVFWSGTSMAGPHVAGAVALLWSAKPELIGQIDETARLFTSTATRAYDSQSCGGVAGTVFPNNTYGFGRLNVLAAVQAASALKQ